MNAHRSEAGPSSPYSPNGQTGHKVTTEVNKVSCVECRRVKCRCIPSTLPDAAQCQRCIRLGNECVYKPHERGRRRKNHSSSQPEPTRQSDTSQSPWKRPRLDQSVPAAPTGSTSLDHRSGTSSYNNANDYQYSPGRVSFSRQSLSTPEPTFNSRNQSDLAPGEASSELEPPANSVYHAVANRSRFAIASVMDRGKDGRDGTDTSPSSALTMRDDPVSLGILTIEECDSLFDHYHGQLQTCVCLLDPTIHNATYTRDRSLQLFTAVLAVSSKFFRPELYEMLLTLANRLIGQAIFDSVYAIELVQAICLLHYWKKPTDSSGWLRLGHAIRLGYQLDLHLPRRGELPGNEREARLVIDRERTWISLLCFDSTMTELSDRPSMMHKAPDVNSWLRSIPYPLPSDGQLEFAVKTSLLSSEVRQLQESKGSYEVLRSGLSRVQEDLQRSHRSLTSTDAHIHLTSTSTSIIKFSALAQRLLIECTSLSLAPRSRRIALLHACVSTSLDVLDVVVEEFAKKGLMPMIEDAHSVAVASTAVRLIRFLTYLDAPARAAVMRKLTKVVIVCREAARGDQGCHPAYLARFVHTLVDKAHHSRQPSRVPSPDPQHPQHHVNLPLQQKTTPEQWWEEIGQLVYQEPVQSLEEHQDFWDGFPSLAGAIHTAPRLEGWDPLGHDPALAAANGLL